MDANEVIKKGGELKNFWSGRNRRFLEWYKLIEMIDELKQDKMESFVGNDPQSSFKLLRHMLDQQVPHRIAASEALSQEFLGASIDIERMYEVCWQDVFERYRLRGRQGWIWDLAGFLLATGWYSVFATLSEDGSSLIADVLNPATVFPSWEDQLVECAHIDTLSPIGAVRMAARNNWTLTPPRGNLILTDYWRMDENGQVFNSVVIGKELVKPETLERFHRIPIFISPVGGLPDTGAITQGTKWREEIGQSSVSTNENIYKSVNKWWTFVMQILRDTAQPKFKEKSRTGKPIAKPEDMNRRGAIFRMTPEEDIEYMTPPPIPVELRTTQLDMEAMMQRGGPSWSMFGNFSQPLTAYVMSQIASSTNQVAKPFHRGVIDCMTDIDNFILKQMQDFKYQPYGMKLPKTLPPGARMTADYELRIPGDIIQRATAARMLHPDFRISYSRVIAELFPEIKNSLVEQAQVLADMANFSEIRVTIALIDSLRKDAANLRGAKDTQAADLYDKAANMLESKIEGQGAPQTSRNVVGNRTEAIPPNLTPVS